MVKYKTFRASRMLEKDCIADLEASVNQFITENQLTRKDIISCPMTIHMDSDSMVGSYYGYIELVYWKD